MPGKTWNSVRNLAALPLWSGAVLSVKGSKEDASLCRHYFWLHCKSGLCFQASLWRKQLGRRGECQRVWNSFCCVSHTPYSAACLPLRHSAFKIIDDYTLPIFFFALEKEHVGLPNPSSGPSERAVPVDVTVDPRVAASCWLWCNTPALCAGGTQLQLPNFGSVLNPASSASILGKLTWRQRSWDWQWQGAGGWWASLHPCVMGEMHSYNEQGYELSSLSDREKQQRNNSFTLCSSKAWAPQIENSKPPSKQK